MTTKFLDNKICTFKILLSRRFPQKLAFWTIFLPAPKAPPSQKRKFYFYCRLAVSDIFQGARDINPGERHSHVTQDDDMVTLCTLRAATVLSCNCCEDFGRPLTEKVMSHSRDGPGAQRNCQKTLHFSFGW